MTQQVQRAPLTEPLLEEIPRAQRSEAPGPSAPVAWIEFTHSNGRGRAALTAFLLGLSCSIACVGLVLLPSATTFFVYFLLLIYFHMSEYLLTAAFRPDTLGFDNFLLNHSTAYQAMVLVAWSEYWLEWAFFGDYCGKQWGGLSTIGLVACLVGLTTRSLGMGTASTNFSHRIEESKRARRRSRASRVCRPSRWPMSCP